MASTPVAAQPVPQQSEDVPMFVGPATLELTGSRGTHVWDEVRFGSDEVVALLTADAAAASHEPCTTRVRLPVGGVAEDSGDETAMTLSAEPAHRSVDAAILPVGYATSRLRVDSDCERWTLAFTPLPDPDLPSKIVRRTYPVRGDTLAEIAPQTRRVRGSFAAYTTWDTDWRMQLTELGDRCQARDGDVSLTARIIEPVWRRPDDAAPGLVRRWRRFAENLETHELGHVTIALQGAHAIDALLDEGVSAPTCEQAMRRADRAATELHERWERINARYDERTDHGLLQGTGFD
jgi:predicted secreted Zn-dependent protease